MFSYTRANRAFVLRVKLGAKKQQLVSQLVRREMI